MAPGSSLGPDTPWLQVAGQATQISMASARVWYLDTNMAPSGSSDSQYPTVIDGNRRYEQQTQTLAVVGSWTQTQILAATQTEESPWPQVAAEATQISMALEVARLLDTNTITGHSLDPRQLCDLW